MLDQDGCEMLASAIIKQACQEWQTALELLKKYKESKEKEENRFVLLIAATKMLRENMRFFRSANYGKLTSMDADYLITKMNEPYCDDIFKYLDSALETVGYGKYRNASIKDIERTRKELK